MVSVEKMILERKKNGFTQETLSEKLGISRQAVSLWERGDTSPSMENLRQLSDLYGVSVDYLLNDGAEPPAAAVAVMEKPEEKAADNRWRKPALIGVVVGLAIALAIALMATVYFAGYDKGVKDTTPTYPVHTDILDEEDFEEPGHLNGW